MVEFDVQRCRERLRKREEDAYQEREARRQAAHRTALTAIQTVLPCYPAVSRVYLFGSVTCAGAFHPDSDIDIAVEGTTAEEYFALWRDLEQVAPGWTIDLRELDAGSYFAETVRERGELVYERENSDS